MAMFRKKPVVIEAVQWLANRESWAAIQTLAAGSEGVIFLNGGDGAASLDIPTLEGTMKAVHGDWIIKGVEGEFYPCKPDIFAATYEAADDKCEPGHA